MKRWVYTVKLVLDPPVTLPWAVYRQAADAPAVTRLVALAGTEADAQRVADMLSGDDDQVEHIDDQVEAGAP